VKTASIVTNRIPGGDWIGTSSGGFFPTYCVQEAKPHIVTFTLSDGTALAWKA